MSTEVHGAPGAPESDSGEGRRGSRIERLRAALSLPTLRRATGLLDGRHKSVFVGRGQDFDDMSFYRPGDDISDIDWKSSARLGQPVIKRYQRESMMPMVLAVDTGRTMAAMTPSGEDKRDLALGVAEVFAYLARMRGDSVALVAGDAGRMISRPARSGAKHVETLLALLARTYEDLDAPVEGAPGVFELAPGAPPSSLPRLMERVSTWHRRRSLVILITDTAHPGPDAATWLRRLSIQHEMIVVQIEDDDPLRPDGGRGRDIDLPFEIPAFLRADSYLAAQAAVVREQWRTSVEQVLDARHLEYGVVSSEETLIDSIAELLQRERAAVARGRRGPMQIMPPVLMPIWMVIVMVVGLLLVTAWLLRTFLVTRRDISQEVGDIPMAPRERRQWGERLSEISQRWDAGDLDLRELHLELAALLRGFAEARSGEEITTATVSEILDMAATAGPSSVEERRRSVRAAGRPLDINPLGHVGELLAVWEQPSFDREPQAAAQEALTHAREVVTRW